MSQQPPLPQKPAATAPAQPQKPAAPATPSAATALKPSPAPAAPAGATHAKPAAPATPAVDPNEDVINKVKEGVKSAVIKGDFDIPPLPHVTAEVMKILNNPNVGLNQIEALVKQDPAMTARMIKMANSVMYRGAVEITSLQMAMARIGLKNVKDVVVTLGIQSKAFQIQGFEDIMAKIFEHCIACANVSQMVAKSLLGDKELAFLAGLLVNIGRPVLVQILAKVEAQARITAQGEARVKGQKFDPKTWRMPGLREKVLPVAMNDYYNAVGNAVGARWQLPEAVVNAIQFHNDPTKAPENYKKLAYTVHLAQKICKNFGFGQDIIQQNFEGDAAGQFLGFSEVELKELLEDIPDAVSQQLSAFSS